MHPRGFLFLPKKSRAGVGADGSHLELLLRQCVRTEEWCAFQGHVLRCFSGVRKKNDSVKKKTERNKTKARASHARAEDDLRKRNRNKQTKKKNTGFRHCTKAPTDLIVSWRSGRPRQPASHFRHFVKRLEKQIAFLFFGFVTLQ